jgi:hypothetical protein
MSFGPSGGLCRWRHAALDQPRDPVDLSRFDEPDLGVVDLLARATLEARQRGDRLVCRGAPRRLLDFLDFCGLEEVVAAESAARET